MAPFFNATPESPDLQLLPSGVRGDEDLALVVADCEAAIVAKYTVTLWDQDGTQGPSLVARSVPTGAYALDATNGVYVCLRGFHPEPESCAAGLREALRRELVNLIRWRRAQWRADPLTTSESDGGQGGKAKSFRDDRLQTLPPGFGTFLRPYDVRPPAAHI